MKKLLIIFVLAIAMTSCYVSVDKSVKEPTKETTTYLQNLPKDSLATVAYDGHDVYVFDNKTNVIKYKAVCIEEDAFPVGIIPLIFLLLFTFCLGVIAGNG